MKLSKILKISVAAAVSLSMFSCAGKKGSEPQPEPTVVEEEPAPVVETEPPAPVVPEPEKEEPKKTEPKKETPQKPEPKAEEVKKEEPKPAAPEKEDSKPSDEYKRSVGQVAVSKDDFEKDKKEILRIIDELSGVMKDKNYKSWLTYVDSESLDYWQRPANLKKAQNRLPVKGLALRNLEDYFKYVFIPARKDRTISEIRYESNTYVKAVQVEDGEDIVYYYFNKINGKWMLHLPPINK